MGGGGGGFRLKPHIEVNIQVNVIPYRDFSKSKFLPQGELKEKFDTASSRGLP